MRGLDPRIHHSREMDHRVKPGDDDLKTRVSSAPRTRCANSWRACFLAQLHNHVPLFAYRCGARSRLKPSHTNILATTNIGPIKVWDRSSKNAGLRPSKTEWPSS